MTSTAILRMLTVLLSACGAAVLLVVALFLGVFSLAEPDMDGEYSNWLGLAVVILSPYAMILGTVLGGLVAVRTTRLVKVQP